MPPVMRDSNGGAQVSAKISLSQVVALMIERWDELAEGVKVEIVKSLRHVRLIFTGAQTPTLETIGSCCQSYFGWY